MLKAYVINLDREFERRNEISAQLLAQDIPFSVFPAVDGHLLDGEAVARAYDEAAARKGYRELSRGELGCALSHLGVYRQILADKVDHALVLEDDARLGPDVKQVLRELAVAIPASSPLVVLLSHVDKYTRWSSQPLGETASLVRRYGEWWRAHAYFITRAAAAAMLENLYPVQCAADCWSRFEKRGVIEVKALVPYSVSLSELAERSSLEPHRADKDAADKARRSFGYYLRRYGYQRFLHQLLIRPFLRVARQKRTW